MARRTRGFPATAAVRAGWAAALLLVPHRLLRAAGPAPVPAAAVAVARVLGARHLLQAAAGAWAPAGPVTRLGAVVDILHTGSCVAFAAVSPRWRRAALLDALVEAGFAVAGGDGGTARRRR
ncbi:hypothetical protein [Actinoplanes nipponensis]|nr:hypothetical protein [Actinoplanes nipponensis]